MSTPPARTNQSWMTNGACAERDPALFFPSTGAGVMIAQKICAKCPVQAQCLEYALEHGIEHGVWGGVSERGRRKLATQRRRERLKLAAR